MEIVNATPVPPRTRGQRPEARGQRPYAIEMNKKVDKHLSTNPISQLFSVATSILANPSKSLQIALEPHMAMGAFEYERPEQAEPAGFARIYLDLLG